MNKRYIPIRQRINDRKKEDARQKKIQFSDFLVDVARNPMILIGLGGSAILTSLAGLFIGLAPKLDAQGTLSLFGGVPGWASAAIGIFFGVLYAIVFPIIGEWGTYYWHKKASLRDVGNKWQAAIGYGMLAVAFGFTVTTAIAASVILASLLHTFSAFQAIPEWAQKWTILIIPISLALHAGANMWYDHVSKYAEERREMERGLQTVEIEAENRIRQARIDARERAAIAMAEEYENLSKVEAIETGKEIAKRAWKKDKSNMGGDDDKDGTPNLVDTDSSSESAYTPPPQNTSSNQQWYDMNAFLDAMRISNVVTAQARWTNKTYQQFAQEVSRILTISGKNMRKIFFELYPEKMKTDNGQKQGNFH